MDKLDTFSNDSVLRTEIPFVVSEEKEDDSSSVEMNSPIRAPVLQVVDPPVAPKLGFVELIAKTLADSFKSLMPPSNDDSVLQMVDPPVAPDSKSLEDVKDEKQSFLSPDGKLVYSDGSPDPNYTLNKPGNVLVKVPKSWTCAVVGCSFKDSSHEVVCEHEKLHLATNKEINKEGTNIMDTPQAGAMKRVPSDSNDPVSESPPKKASKSHKKRSGNGQPESEKKKPHKDDRDPPGDPKQDPPQDPSDFSPDPNDDLYKYGKFFRSIFEGCNYYQKVILQTLKTSNHISGKKFLRTSPPTF